VCGRGGNHDGEKRSAERLREGFSCITDDEGGCASGDSSTMELGMSNRKEKKVCHLRSLLSSFIFQLPLWL
jgi:hypothetical protein